jgi:hypothetical protein
MLFVNLKVHAKYSTQVTDNAIKYRQCRTCIQKCTIEKFHTLYKRTSN